MKIFLLNRHEALIVADRVNSVTVEPETDGILTVDGEDYPISCGGAVPGIKDAASHTVRAAFTTKMGIRYTVLSACVERGSLVSRIDPFSFAVKQRLDVDRIEKEVEILKENLRELRGSIRYDALGFIITNKTEELKQ